MNTYNVSSTEACLLLRYDFVKGDPEFATPTPVNLDGYYAKLIITCTKQVLVNQKTEILEFSSLDSNTIVVVRDNKVFIDIDSKVLSQSRYTCKLTLISDSYRLPVSTFYLNVGFSNSYPSGVIVESYNFSEDGFALLNINRGLN